MSKLYFAAFILILCHTSCKKDTAEIPPDKTQEVLLPVEDPAKYDQILRTTGCKVKQAGTIKEIFTYKDSVANTTYLYGSRILKGAENMWVSRYNSTGDVVWDTTYVNPQGSVRNQAYAFTKLDNEKFAIFQLEKAELRIISSTLFLVNSKSAEIISKPNLNGTTYVNILKMRESFIVYNREADLLWITNGSRSFVQLNTIGGIINNIKPIKILPANTDLIINDQAFLTLTGQFKLQSIFNDTLWKTKQPLPTLKSYEIKNGILSLSYINDAKLVDTMQFDLTTNKVILDTHHIPSVSYTLARIAQDYIASDGFTVHLNSFIKTKNGLGTTYYDISYTLKNYTTDRKVIYEGNFDLLYSDTTKIERQGAFFTYIYPGESITRTYQYKTLDKNVASFLRYNSVSVLPKEIPIYWSVPK